MDQADKNSWRPSLRAFFDTRAQVIAGAPSILDLCFISGREPRLWSDPEMRSDLTQSIVATCGLTKTSRLLEVGCAAGFLAQLIAPEVGAYVGVDLSRDSLRVAQRLGLPNATFEHADGHLPFIDGGRHGGFDAVLCYDVYTNFPTFEDGAGLIAEMLRVARRGAPVLVGSIPDAATEAEYIEIVPKVVASFEERYGPVPPQPAWAPKVQPGAAAPTVTNFYFSKDDFVTLGEKLGASVEIADIHRENPYFGYRFNAIYQKQA
jgi:SAM-dependent methyltransferase